MRHSLEVAAAAAEEKENEKQQEEEEEEERKKIWQEREEGQHDAAVGEVQMAEKQQLSMEVVEPFAPFAE